MILIAGVAAFGTYLLVAGRPDATKVSRGAQPTFVKVLTARAQDEQVVVAAYGAVQAHRRLTVQPEVGGRVVWLNPNVVTGGLLRAQEALLRIDTRDYRFAVDEQRASLAKAEFDLKMELGSQAVAKREWDLLNPSSREINALSRQLALRRPHLKEKLAGFAAAKSRLRKAQLDLRRTVVRAPFNALVLSESAETGQLVNSQSVVATLVGTDEFRAQVSVPIHQLEWITFPGRGRPHGASVRVIRERGKGDPVTRRGAVVELLGDVTQNGRMAQILVSIPDPLELDRPARTHQPLLLGEYVRVDIEGPVLHNVVVLPRHTIREGARVWIKNAENRLDVRTVDIILARRDTAIIGRGLRGGEEIIAGQLPAAIPGLLVQTLDDSAPPGAERAAPAPAK